MNFPHASQSLRRLVLLCASGACAILIVLWAVPLSVLREECRVMEQEICIEAGTVRQYGFPAPVRRSYIAGEEVHEQQINVGGIFANFFLFFAPPFILGLMQMPEASERMRRRKPHLPSYRATMHTGFS